MRTQYVALLAIALLAGACQKETNQNVNGNNALPEDIKELIIPGDFGFETTTDVKVSIDVKGLDNRPLSGKRLSFYDGNPEREGNLLSTAFTNPGGMAEVLVQVPAYVPELYVVVNAAGISNTKAIPVKKEMSASFGGKYAQRSFKRSAVLSTPTPISGNYYYMGGFTQGSKAGFPNYLEPVGDNITQAFLDDIDASLPESSPVPTNNPQYLTVGNELDVVVVEKSDVWVTFITEGAGYKNALGYYVFDSNNPPNSPADIDSIFVVLPNASLDGAGGKLQPGDKIKLGTFEPGKTISWVLFQNAWNGVGVDVTKQKYYSRIDFNDESDPSKKQHTVQLADISRQLLLNGFEDQNRSKGSDNDFNDLVFYVTANPWEGIDIGGIPPVKPKEDKDNDGVSDDSDDYPNDPTRAVRNDYNGTLAYEDLWPSQGDYDFNDMVIDYNIGHVLNSANKLVEIDADWTVRAVGAAFANGFGYQFEGITSGAIQSVTGQDLQENIINNGGNGAEQGQNLATVIAFDNVFNIIQGTGGSFINTVPSAPEVPAQTVTNFITFVNPQVQGNVGLPPYNPFIFVNGERSHEVHLVDHAPTALMDMSLFGTQADASNPNAGETYTTENGLPWAMNIGTSFDYPVEYAPVDDAYLFFSSWATSGGSQNEDWYLDVAGYRDNSKVY